MNIRKKLSISCQSHVNWTWSAFVCSVHSTTSTPILVEQCNWFCEKHKRGYMNKARSESHDFGQPLWTFCIGWASHDFNHTVNLRNIANARVFSHRILELCTYRIINNWPSSLHLQMYQNTIIMQFKCCWMSMEHFLHIFSPTHQQC